MVQQISEFKTTKPRQKGRQTWFRIGSFLFIVCMILFAIASVPELRELSCRNDASPNMTCQLTYQSLISKETRTVEAVQAVEIEQEDIPAWLVNVFELEPTIVVASLVTTDGPYLLTSYGGSRHNLIKEIDLFYNRIRILERSPSEGISMSFSRRKWYILLSLSKLLFRGCAVFFLVLAIGYAYGLCFLSGIILPAFFLAAFYENICDICFIARKKLVNRGCAFTYSSLRLNHRRLFTAICRLKQSLSRYHNLYLLLVVITIFLLWVLWLGIEPNRLIIGAYISFTVGLAGLIIRRVPSTARPDNLLNQTTFSNRLKATFYIPRNSYLEPIELINREKRQAQSVAIYRLAIAIAQHEPFFTPELSDIMHTVFYLNSHFLTTSEATRSAADPSCSSRKHSSTNWQKPVPDQKMSRRQFPDKTYRLYQVRQRMDQIQQHLQSIYKRLIIGEIDTDTLPVVLDLSTHLQSLVKTTATYA